MELVHVRENQSLLSVNDYQEVLSRISDGLEILQRTKKEIKKKLRKGIHYDKPFKGAKQDILLKAGADQLAYLTGIEVVERKDEEIRDGQGNIIGYKVTLKLRSKLLGNKEVISSRIASKDEAKAKNWSLDMLLAMAFKRAWVYGVIQLTGLSDMFIDEEKEEINKPSTEKQRAYLRDLLKKKGLSEEEFEKKYGKIDELTFEQASKIIEVLKRSF
ncbi:hypothetical protein [Aquifex sp.]